MYIKSERTKWHVFALESEYDPNVVAYCQFLKSTLGWKEFTWDSVKKKWRFKDLAIVSMLRNKFPNIQIEPSIIDALDSSKMRDEKSVEIKKKTETNFKIMNVKGAPYEYQKIGVEFLNNSGGRALLADSPGVGKTMQGLGYIAHNNFKRTLVVCPASVKFSWEDEVDKWTYLSSFVVDPKTEVEEIPFDANVVIINFDLLKKFFEEFMKYHWDCLIVDEAHLIKNPSAIRSKVIASIASNIKNVILLTGTPVLSRPSEMFNMLNIIDPYVWNNYYEYAVKYCEGGQGRWGFEAKGASNLDELSQKIGRYFLRRTKDEVLSELPKKIPITRRINLTGEWKKAYEKVEKDLKSYLKSKNKNDYEIDRSLAAEKLVQLNLLREINANGKLESAIELIDSIIESGEKVIVLSSFNSPLLELRDRYEENSVMILGSTPIGERGEAVKQFQTLPNKNVFIGGIKSAGVGITLTAASNVIFLDLPWNPADIEQGENRAHRPSAKGESLNIYKIVTNGTVDVFMEKLLEYKQSIVDKLIDNDTAKKVESKMLKEYLKSVYDKYK